MNNTLIVCYSNKDINRKNLLCELAKICNSDENLIHFSNEPSLIEWLKSEEFLDEKKRLIILDLEDSDKKTINFIKSVNQQSKKAIKLIIAENHQLYEIQQKVENNGLIQFLNKSWELVDLNIAMNIASHTFSIYQNPTKYFGTEKINEQNSGEILNERLQKLMDANLAKDNFLSIIAHDLKTPFSALLGMSEILVDNWETLSEEDKLELIADLRKTSVDTYKLLENLLVWAKSQKEKLEVTVNNVEIHNLVNSVLKISKKNASVKSIKIKNNIDENLIIKTDENMIATVFRNLISNAVQHIHPGGNITITAELQNESCKFCVADNGKGIDLQYILELFNKNNPKKLNGNVTACKGLGLIICKDFVEKNGGQIWLETQPEQGCKFYFTIPN
jgi:two-component system sensor histidine kinase/response regulator